MTNSQRERKWASHPDDVHNEWKATRLATRAHTTTYARPRRHSPTLTIPHEPKTMTATHALALSSGTLSGFQEPHALTATHALALSSGTLSGFPERLVWTATAVQTLARVESLAPRASHSPHRERCGVGGMCLPHGGSGMTNPRSIGFRVVGVCLNPPGRHSQHPITPNYVAPTGGCGLLLASGAPRCGGAPRIGAPGCRRAPRVLSVAAPVVGAT